MWLDLGYYNTLVKVVLANKLIENMNYENIYYYNMYCFMGFVGTKCCEPTGMDAVKSLLPVGTVAMVGHTHSCSLCKYDS